MSIGDGAGETPGGTDVAESLTGVVGVDVGAGWTWPMANVIPTRICASIGNYLQPSWRVFMNDRQEGMSKRGCHQKTQGVKTRFTASS